MLRKEDKRTPVFTSSKRRRNRLPRSRERSNRSRRRGTTDSRSPFSTCEQEVAFIARYLSSDLSGNDVLAFERHLAVCRDCAAFLQTYRATIELTRSFLTGHGSADWPPRWSRTLPD
jgi:hypothetical protein